MGIWMRVVMHNDMVLCVQMDREKIMWRTDTHKKL